MSPRQTSRQFEKAQAMAATFLDLVASGVSGANAAKELGVSVRMMQRYAEVAPAFKTAFDEAKAQARLARAAARPKVAKAPPPRPKPKPPERVPPVTPPPKPVYLEQIEAIQPEGLQLNPGLPPLSVQSHLAKLQAQHYADNTHPSVRREAMRQLGTYILGPSLMRKPGRPSHTEADQPAQIGTGAPQVLLMAPDNGLYAPGCGPAEGADAAEVVDGAEAEGAELVTLVASGEE